ncbi:MAG: phosphatidylglycerol lysyltransferase domain-containing protein [Pseudomonadota bacterium]
MDRYQIAMVARRVWRLGLPVMILTVCALMLSRQVSTEALASLPDQLGDITPAQWLLAFLFTTASFFAVAQYDVQAHRVLGTGVCASRARLTGAVGIAIGQTVGFGLVSGALARWRMLPEVGTAQALKLSTFVALSFVVAWACLTGLVSLISPAPPWAIVVSVGGILLIPGGAALLFFFPTLRIGQHQIPLPSLPIAGAILLWALVDMVFAAAALWVLMPQTTIGFFTLLPLFMIALGCGLMSNTPGGVGPFELVLVAALPVGAETGVLAAILAFRCVYYALPACLAMVAMLWPLSQPTPGPTPEVETQWQKLPRCEALALTQNGGRMARIPTGETAPIWPTAQTETVFTGPTGRACPATLEWLCGEAQQRGRVAMLYKSDARLAAVARRDGWAVLHIADDAIVDLAEYDEKVPARRRLRRKLRAACKAGVTICSNALPDASAAKRLDQIWQSNAGGARGGSMGRYCPHYTSNQWVVSAYSGRDLVAFVTLHRHRTEWCVDIMRHDTALADGVMHALVHQALLDARSKGARRVNLASIIACPDPSSRVWRALAQHAVSRAGGMGLRQFKSSFAPRWVPRYAAAPSWPGLALGLADLARVIRSPAPITGTDAKHLHHNDENYEVASRSAA